MTHKLKKIVIEARAEQDGLTRDILRGYPNAQITVTDSESEFPSGDTDGKHILYISHSRGAVFKPCPGTHRNYLCCNYYVINQMQNCPLNCTYCILQDYVNRPGLTLYSNTGEIIREIGDTLRADPRRLFRIGTGELSDSLAFYGARLFAVEIVKAATQFHNAVLELKTKSDNVEELLSLDSQNKTVVSWSLNPPSIVRREEFNTASISNRLKAARRLSRNGYLVGFHFDPILHVKGWKAQYRELIDTMFNHVDASRIAWISLGTLRFPPAMHHRIARQFPKTRIIFDEFVRGMDGKLRYSKPLREMLYESIYGYLKESMTEDIFTYFCMESHDVWRHITGQYFRSNDEFEERFTVNLMKRFPHLMNRKQEVQ